MLGPAGPNHYLMTGADETVREDGKVSRTPLVTFFNIPALDFGE